MAWDTTELKRRFSRPENEDIVAYLVLHHPSSHSDVGGELITAGKAMPEYLYFCPNGLRCSYMLLHTRSGIVYAVALGMNDFTLRLPTEEVEAALREGGKPKPDIGKGWVAFDPFDVDVRAADRRAKLERWCRRAYDHANVLTAADGASGC